jgi:glyceraldehyde-3-phosphate dehydrogenase (NAD(P))
LIKVAINGYGTIGKRVADAVTAQDDMEVLGVTKTRPTYEVDMAREKGFPLYAALPDKVKNFEDACVECAGTLEDLMAGADIVVDCAPGKLGVANKAAYEKAGIKAIFQGGEKHETAGTSFNAMANFEEAVGKQFVRVVSCNTTGLCRTLYPLEQEFGIEGVLAVMVRRSADPGDSKRGPINAIEPVLKVPSHHGPDVQTVMHELNIQTMAVKVPSTIMHMHCNVVELKTGTDSQAVVDLWEKTGRVRLVEGGKGVTSTAQIMELARDLGAPRSDLNEIAVWRDGVHVVGKTLYYYQAIHQESDVIPEEVDCIRAMCLDDPDKMTSIQKTDKALGLA